MVFRWSTFGDSKVFLTNQDLGDLRVRMRWSFYERKMSKDVWYGFFFVILGGFYVFFYTQHVIMEILITTVI